MIFFVLKLLELFGSNLFQIIDLLFGLRRMGIRVHAIKGQYRQDEGRTDEELADLDQSATAGCRLRYLAGLLLEETI